MPEWEISFKEYLERLQLSSKHFREQLNLPRIKDIKKVLPLRNLEKIESIIPIRNEVLLKMIRKIKTLDNRSPFKRSTISLVKVDPHQLKIGQKFVYRENYQNLLENLPKIFREFSISSGFSDLGAFMVFGTDKHQAYCLSYYIPPIIEKHKADLIIMDGIHRNFINKQMGATLNAIMVENVNAPFPCSIHSWDEIQIIPLKNKPRDINKRYFDLNKNLFRDLKYLGIDG